MAAGQFTMQLGAFTNNVALVQRGAQAMLASGQLNAEQTATVRQMLQGLSTDAVSIKVEEMVRANNPRGALAELRTAVANQPAGQKAPASWYARATSIAVSNNIADEALYWSARQAELYPSSQNWLAATQVVKQFAALDPQEKLDVFRLMSRSGALNNEPRFVAPEYLEYADMANLRAFYNEAVKTIDQGRASGALTQQQGAQIRAAANARIAADRASLPGQERDARASSTGVAAVAAADVYLNFGEAAKAEELYKLALQKGGIDKDRALTRLGIAQFDQGKYAAAQDSFSKVTGQRRLPIARLWLTLVGQKDPSAVPRRAG
jgi:tetratricopeptide (TPR) repeat protein